MCATALYFLGDGLSPNNRPCESWFTWAYAGPVRTTACSIGGGGGT
jgi:hypothetical protein